MLDLKNMGKNDQIGDILRKFYSLYGRPEEGPSPAHDISELLQEVMTKFYPILNC